MIVRITTNIYLIKHSENRGVIPSENKRDEARRKNSGEEIRQE